jgi:hypothetical protein
LKNKSNMPTKTTSPKGGKRGCLCKDNKYRKECCEGELSQQGIGSTVSGGTQIVINPSQNTTVIIR